MRFSCGRNHRWIRRQDDALWVHVLHAHRDVDLVLAELDEATAPWERLGPEATCIVAGEVECPIPLDEARINALSRLGDDVARPDEDSIKHLLLPYGGRQLSWWWHDRCHG